MKTEELIEKFIEKHGYPETAMPNINNELRSELTALLKETAREQVAACYAHYTRAQSENIIEKISEANRAEYEGEYHNLRTIILDTPLVTNNE